MDSQKTNRLYERFPHLYRERTAPLESSKMAWGFQCDDGWHKIIYDMSQKIKKISGDGEHTPAITEISRNEDGTLYVSVRNLTPPIADIVATAVEHSRLTCERCGYSPAFLRKGTPPVAAQIACGRCARQAAGNPKRKPTKRNKRPRRAPDIVVVKR